MGKKNKKFLDILRKLAPNIATALGGPLAGNAVKALSQAILGKGDGTEAEIEDVLVNDPDSLLKLKEAEYEFKAIMAKLEITEDELVYKNTDSARQRHITVGDQEPARLAYLAMVIFAVLVAVVLTQTVMIEASEFAKVIVATMLGASISWVNAGYNFFLGSSKGSQAKTDSLTDAVQRSFDK